MLTPDTARIVTVDSIPVEVPAGATVIAALVVAATLCTRRSVTRQKRFAFCGIGQCQECRVTINGNSSQLACRTICQDGMDIVTGDNS